MAKLQKKRSNKGAVPTMEEASNNLGAEEKQVLKAVNFKLSESFVKEFKQYALDHDLSLTDLFRQSFQFFKTNR